MYSVEGYLENGPWPFEISSQGAPRVVPEAPVVKTALVDG
jgi:hypothetical protein